MSLSSKSSENFSKVQATTAQLQTLASQVGPHGKLPTHRQLRHSMGVSITTLNSALSELEARRLIYRVQGSGIYVAATARRSIALVCDPAYFQGANHSPFWDVLLEQARQWATTHDEILSFHFAAPAATAAEQSGEMLHEGLVRDIQAGRVHGIIAVGLPVPVTEWVRDQGVPLVAFAGWSDYTVGLDGVELIRLGVAELARQGCRRIGLWRTVDLAHTLEATRTDAEAITHIFRQSLVDCGVPFHAALIKNNRHLLMEADKPRVVLTKQEQGYQTAIDVFSGSHRKATPKPDGVIITDDMMTHGALVALQKLGVMVGQELKIATHANRGSMVLLGRDELTLLEIDPAEVVQALFEMLETLMDGKTPATPIVSIKPKAK
ncbi:MAG: substrate-binding domain-containing protein [Abitibacteriaceae bacterium]|nr:substrate-binding domain-containing protein [Abditibacteriaceae bacterium]MBV9864974.1 substrate-binding domain-containing protein [Abditibacteriaceae bacterium]